MATATDIATVRELINEPNDTNGWTDQRISNSIDVKSGDLNAAAADIWGVKAAETYGLVDVSENGSSRKLSDLQKQALSMQAHFQAESDRLVGIVARAPRTRAIVRP